LNNTTIYSILCYFVVFLNCYKKHVTIQGKEVVKMDKQWLIRQIEEKREALKKLLRSKDFNLKDEEIIKLSQELDELLLQYVKYKAQE